MIEKDTTLGEFDNEGLRRPPTITIELNAHTQASFNGIAKVIEAVMGFGTVEHHIKVYYPE